MAETGYQCPACGLKVKGPEGLEYMPSKRLDLCKWCIYWDWILPVLSSLFFLIAMVVPFLPCSMLTTKQGISLSGLGLDITGVTLLFGKMERPIIVTGLLRGEGKDPLEVALPKHVWQTRFGWLLVIVGFFLQASTLFL